MAIDNLIDVEYKTGNLSHERVREGILKNKDRLTQMGYKCRWTGDLDLNAMPSDAEMRSKGYSPIQDCIITSFFKDGLPYTISIFSKSQRTKIHGDNTIRQGELPELEKELKELQKATGIHLNLKQVSEPYRA